LSIEERRERLKRDLAQLEALKSEETYVCSSCDKHYEGKPYEDGLCVNCHLKAETKMAQESAEKLLAGGTVVSVYVGNITDEVIEIVIEKDGKKQKITAGGWDERYLEVDEI